MSTTKLSKNSSVMSIINLSLYAPALTVINLDIFDSVGGRHCGAHLGCVVVARCQHVPVLQLFAVVAEPVVLFVLIK